MTIYHHMNDVHQVHFKDKITAFLRVSRADLLITSFGHATLGMILGAMMIEDLIQMKVFLYILLHYSIAFFACNINCYFDYHIDRHYKTMLSRSVEIVTKRWLTVIMVIECGIAIGLASWFFFQGYGIVSLLSMIGLFAAFTYSAEPIRFKRRGVFSPLLILILYSLPILGGWVLFQQEFTSIIGLFLFGYILMNEGFTLVNMCEDYDEDRKENIITWAHRLGIEKTVKIAVIFSLSGLFCVLSLLLKMNDFSISIKTVVFILLIGLTSVSIGKASYEVYEILSYDDLKKATKTYGRRLQRWFLITRFPLILSALVILI